DGIRDFHVTGVQTCALPIWRRRRGRVGAPVADARRRGARACSWSSSAAPNGQASDAMSRNRWRSEEHTSELQSREKLVCRLLLEKKLEVIRHDVTSCTLIDLDCVLHKPTDHAVGGARIL